MRLFPLYEGVQDIVIDVFVLSCVANIGGSGLSERKYILSVFNVIKLKVLRDK